MSYLILSNINLDIVNKQSTLLINYLNKLKKRNKIYYLNIFSNDIENKFKNTNIIPVNFIKWIKDYTFDLDIIKLYDDFIKYKYNVLINSCLENPNILISIFLDNNYKKNIKTYIDLIYKISLELKVEKIYCYDLILIEYIYNLLNLYDSNPIQYIIRLQKKIKLYVLDEINYFDSISNFNNIINFKGNYKNYFLSIILNNKYIFELNKNLNYLSNLEYENIINIDNNNSLISKYYFLDIVDNNINEKLKNIKKVLLQEKNNYMVFSHFSNKRICLTIYINYLYYINNKTLWFLISNNCKNSDYDNYFENELNNIISNSMIYINLLQKVIELIFTKLIKFFNENSIINKDLKLDFNFIGRCFFNLEDLNNKNFEYNYNIKNLENIEKKIEFGFNKINKNFIDSYLINLDTLKINLGLYANVENIVLRSNMFFNNYSDELNPEYPKYKALINPDLILKFYNVEDALDKCDTLVFEF